MLRKYFIARCNNFMIKASSQYPSRRRSLRFTCRKPVAEHTNPELSSVVALNVEEGRDHLWAKTKEAFKYIYQHHLDEAEWFLKADDDTYVIVENLRFFLKDFDSNNAVSLGCKFTQGFFSGGAGYVLSKESVKRFVENSLLDGSKCRQEHDGLEDLEMGTCLYNIGIETTDTRDTIGRYRFLPFNPQIEVVPRNPSDKYWFYMYYPESKGENLETVSANPLHDYIADEMHPMDYMSDRVISFHYVPPKQMYFMDHLLYHVRLHKV